MPKSTLHENRKRTKSAHKAQIILAVSTFVVAKTLWIWWSQQFPDDQYRQLEIADTEVAVEVVETQEEREKGLSGRSELPEGEGMLFVFDEPGLYSFHMKDMEFAIDIIWMDESKRVVGIMRDVSPDTYPQVFTPDSMSRYVLEVPSGFSEEHGVSRGMMASWR